MTDSPCYFRIEHVMAPGQEAVIRLTAADKVRPIVIIDLEPRSFTAALFGEQVIAAISNGRHT